MSSPAAIVYVVDDDAAVRHSLRLLLSQEGWSVLECASADAFLEAYDPDLTSCLVLDVRMPGMDGTDLQTVLSERGVNVPIVFLTGHGELEMGVQAMRRGAVNFLTKPVEKTVLVASVTEALAVDQQQHQTAAEQHALRERFTRLSDRENEVLELVVRGLPNKQIAAELNVTSRTVEFHRANVMSKLGVDSLAELVRLTVLYQQGDGAPR